MTAHVGPLADTLRIPTAASLHCRLLALILVAGTATSSFGADAKSARDNSHTTLADLISSMRGKARALESRSAIKSGFDSFTAKFQLQPGTVTLSDYAMARLFFEATRDAGF